MTKYYQDKHVGRIDRDIPISLSNESINVNDTKTYYCNSCKRPLIKLMNHVGDTSYYCDYGCANEINSAQAELKLRSKANVTMSEGPIEEPAVTQLADPDAAFYNKNKPVYHGGVKTLADKGLKITNYTDSTKNKGWRITRLGKRDNENG